MNKVVLSHKRASAMQVAIASGVGTAIEWYDFILYGTASALVFNHIFFPPSINPLISLLASYATFATGFVARPIGGIIFGHYGDRIGRKTILVLTLLMMGLSTFLVGCLPDYAAIGILAPLALVVLRFIQGLAAGGEWGGAVLMSTEHSPEGKRGFYGSWTQAGASLGNVLSALAFLTVTALFPPSQPAFLAFGWRFPFLASIILIAVGLFIRLRVAETPDFEQVKQTGKVARIPLFQLLRHDVRNLLLGAGLFIGASTSVYIYNIWMVSYGTQTLRLPQIVMLNAALIGNCCTIPFVPIAGALSDRYGRRAISLVGAVILVVAAFPAFWLVETRSVPFVISGICLGLFGFMILCGPLSAYYNELFAAHVRYSGAALGYALAAIFGGGLAPFAATALLNLSGSTSWPVILYVIAMSLITLISIFLARTRETTAIASELAAASNSAHS